MNTLNTPDAMNTADRMHAMVTLGQGGFDQLRYQTVPRPQPGAQEVLLQVLAAGINATDINTREGWYGSPPQGLATPDESTRGTAGQAQDANTAKAASAADTADGAQGWNGLTPFPLIQGADCCARVVAYGPGTAGQSPLPAVGTRVLVRSCMRSQGFDAMDTRWLGTDFAGAFAQYVVVPASEVFAVHCPWSDAELATIPCAYGTAENMLHRAAVGKGEHVLVTGASGGVGSAAVQLALRRGARVSALTHADKVDAVRALGAHQVWPRGADLSALTGTVDVVVDNVAGPAFGSMLATLRRGGRFVTSGAIAGAQVALDLRQLYLRDIRLLGCTAWDAEVFPNLVGYIERGEIKPLLGGTFALRDMAQAQQVFLQKKHLGNLVLLP